MKKFFGLGKKDKDKEKEKTKDTPAEPARAAASSTTSKKSNQQQQISLQSLKQEMNYYRGQQYNPREDDNITTESMFKVINGDTGEVVDVRELLGVTEDDFKNNPELLDALMHMNNIQPIETKPGTQEIEEEK